MSDLYTVAGWKFFIGSVATVPSAGISAAISDTFVEVDGWETLGAFGDAAQVITTQLINRARDVKQKGTRNAGSMENRFAILLGEAPDAGQVAMRAAEATNNNYNFKVEAPDAPAGGTPTTYYFIGMVASARNEGGQANTVQMMAATVEINTNIFSEAAAGP